MGLTRAFGSVVIVICCALASACGAGAPSPVTSPPPSRVPAPKWAQEPPLVLDRTIAGTPSSFRLRATEFANLFYQLDCLAQTVHCSREAYDDLWTRELGGLSTDDRAALERWKTLRYRYRGRIDRGDEPGDVGLQVPRPRRQIESRLRLAGFLSSTPVEYTEHLSLFMDPPDIAEERAIVERFAPRFARWWPSKTASLSRSIDAYASLFARPDVQEALSQAARFYRPEFPPGFVMELDMIARPEHDSATSGELLGLRGLIEVVDGEPPEERFPVIAHEIFHAWLASGSYASTSALVRRFVASSDPDAIGAYGLLDETLATAEGNGRVSRIVQPVKFAKRLAKDNGFYNDKLIDGAAKAVLAAMDRHEPGSDSTSDEGFFAMYMAAIHAAFPKGLAPIAHLRPMLVLYDASVRGSYDALCDASHAGQIVSTDEIGTKEANELLEPRGRWPLALLMPASKVEALVKASSSEIDKATAAKILQEARTKKSFVVAAHRPSHSDLYVFVAPDDAAMRRLVDAFVAKDVAFDVLAGP